MDKAPDEKATLTESEFCKRVGISRVTAWRLRERDELPHCRVGNKILYLQRHVDEFLSAHEFPAKPRAASREMRERRIL